MSSRSKSLIAFLLVVGASAISFWLTFKYYEIDHPCVAWVQAMCDRSGPTAGAGPYPCKICIQRKP